MIVTLLSDFGTSDYFVGAMKAAILSRDERIRIVDITHEIPRHDVAAAAFNLLAVYRGFPSGTVHVAVVDPGVGSERAAIAVRAGEWLCVGPDNGTFGYLLEAEASAEARRIEAPSLFGREHSATFHGRDVFAPAGAALAIGFPFADVGPLVAEPVRLQPLKNECDSDGTLRGRVLHVDHFGNCVTSLDRGDLSAGAEAYRYAVGDGSVEEVRPFYRAGAEGVPFAIWGSAGFLEIAVDRGSAAERLRVVAGSAVLARRRATANLARGSSG
ncbi:MAG: SAM-dependent chlorinase/fluorinase [Gemmatimonadota bacterium]